MGTINNGIEQILEREVPTQLLGLFNFRLGEDSDVEIIHKYNLWGRYCFPKYYKTEDAWFHADIDKYNMQAYRSSIKSFTDIVFRGGAKTTRTKLFICFVIANDVLHYRKYFKVLTKDGDNSRQVVTDIYNMFMSPKMQKLYPSTFEKSQYKREETMSAFTTSYGVKILADTVGTDQRGQLQEEARPDFIWFDDFETRLTLRSPVLTKAIGDNMEEARTGLSPEGSCIYTCNYISERGNVHKLLIKKNARNIVLVVPIKNEYGIPNWFHTPEQVAQIEEDAEDFAGEYLCLPSAGMDVIFDREKLRAMQIGFVLRKIGESYKQYTRYNPSHRYAVGADVAGGVGLDSSTSVTIDFDVIPCRVVATYRDNTIKPDIFAHELVSHGERYGECLVAPEKNNDMGGTCIAILKQNYLNIYTTEGKDTLVEGKRVRAKEYGWHTNAATKPKMMFALKKAVDDGLLELVDEDLILEAMSYSRDDLMDSTTNDPRLTTRHFDLLISCAIAWQMKTEAVYEKKQTEEEQRELNEQDKIFDRFGIT